MSQLDQAAKNIRRCLNTEWGIEVFSEKQIPESSKRENVCSFESPDHCRMLKGIRVGADTHEKVIICDLGWGIIIDQEWRKDLEARASLDLEPLSKWQTPRIPIYS